MSPVFKRLLLQVGITAIPFGLYMVSSSSSDAAMILVIPFFLGVPGLLVILFIFVPVELALERRALWISFIAIPLAGAAVPWVLVPLLSSAKDVVGVTWPISLIGLAWGILWDITRLFFRRSDLAQAKDIDEVA